MQCQAAYKKLQEYLDNTLPPAEIQLVEVHLASCAVCRQELASLREIDGALAALPVLTEPANFTEQVMAQVYASPRSLAFLSFLRWEDAVISLAFAWTMTVFLLLSLTLWPHGILTPAVWWDTWLSEPTIEPQYFFGLLANLGMAAAAGISAFALTRYYSSSPTLAHIRGIFPKRPPPPDKPLACS